MVRRLLPAHVLVPCCGCTSIGPGSRAPRVPPPPSDRVRVEAAERQDAVWESVGAAVQPCAPR